MKHSGSWHSFWVKGRGGSHNQLKELFVFMQQYPSQLMGNVNLDLESFPLAEHKWLETTLPNTLISSLDNTPAHFSVLSSLTKQDIQLYLMRSLHPKHLVNVLAVLDNNDPDRIIGRKCTRSQNEHGFLVLIEKINYRLPDLGALSYQDGLYIIRQGVQAITSLSPIFKSFYIEEEAIGITDAGECKFWINSNYFSNSVEVSLIDQDEQFQYERKSGAQQKCFISPISEVCNPEDNTEDQSRTLRSQQKNCIKALNHFIKLIENKMSFKMGKEEEVIYRQAIQKHLVYQDKHGTSDPGRVKVDPGAYNIDRVKQWIYFLCNQAQVSHDYKINIPCKSRSQIVKTKLVRVQSNAQFFPNNREKPAFSIASPLKQANFKIIAQAKTSLKKCQKPVQTNSNTNDGQLREKFQCPNSLKRAKNRESLTIKTQTKCNNHSQITIKTTFSFNQTNCQSRSERNINNPEYKEVDFHKIERSDKEGGDTKVSKEEAVRGEGFEKGKDNTRAVDSRYGCDNKMISWAGEGFGVRELHSLNYNQIFGL